MNSIRCLNKSLVTKVSRFYSTSTTRGEYVRAEFENGVQKITMCHGKTRNSLSMEMMEHLKDELNREKNNLALRAIVLTGDGPVFSAGHNLKELTQDCGRNQHQQIFDSCGDLMKLIIDLPVPVIAKIDGLAAAAGCQLVAQCDMAFCSKESKFSTPGANFGIFCSTPGVALARAVPKATALKMLLTGEPIGSDEAKRTGLVTDVHPVGDLDKEIERVCETIRTKSRSVIALGKRFYYKQIQHEVKQAYELGGQVMVENINTLDGIEGINGFVEKRKPMWKHGEQ